MFISADEGIWLASKPNSSNPSVTLKLSGSRNCAAATMEAGNSPNVLKSHRMLIDARSSRPKEIQLSSRDLHFTTEGVGALSFIDMHQGVRVRHLNWKGTFVALQFSYPSARACERTFAAARVPDSIIFYGSRSPSSMYVNTTADLPNWTTPDEEDMYGKV